MLGAIASSRLEAIADWRPSLAIGIEFIEFGHFFLVLVRTTSRWVFGSWLLGSPWPGAVSVHVRISPGVGETGFSKDAGSAEAEADHLWL